MRDFTREYGRMIAEIMKYRGLYTAIVTPFKNNQIDTEALKALVEAQIAGGVDGIVPVGTTGESPTLSHSEHMEVIRLAIEYAAGRCQVIAGTGSNSTDEAIAMTNEYAPEHLIIETKDYMELAEKVVNAGSVFLGSLTPESAGDYASGTNHTLPTNGYAKAYSGVSLDSFIRKITFQEITREGIQNVGPAIEVMAANEQLDAHKNAVTVRLKSIKNL